MKSGVSPRQPEVDETSGDRDARGNHRNLISAEPLRVRDLDGIAHNLSVNPVGAETEHQRMRKRPRLAADVTHVADGHTDFFHRLANDGLFEGLPRLDETGEAGIHRLLPLHAARKKRLFVIALAARDERDDCGRESWERHQPARKTPHRSFVVESLRGFTAPATEAVRSRPFDQLHRTTRCQPVVFVAPTMEREEVDRGAVGGIEAMGHVDRPHCDVAHHPDEMNVPVARCRFLGLPDIAADDVEIAVAASVSRRFHRWNQARNIGVSAHTASTVPA